MRSSILFLLFLPVLFSCSEKDEWFDHSEESGNIPAGISQVAFRSNAQSLRVYVFRKEENVFRYDSILDSGGSTDGKITAQLPTGDYKFLFTGPLNGQLNVLPVQLDKTVTFEQLRFAAQADTEHPNGVLPIEELFLPEPEVADSIYAIRGNNEIKCTLKRRVSQLEFVLKRGYKKGNEYIPQPFKEGENILDSIKELHVVTTGIGTECNYRGTSGEGTLFSTFSAEGEKSMDTQGFATFEGPYVFPAAEGKEILLDISLVSVSGATYPPLQLRGKLEPNRKLNVTLWLNSTRFDVGLTIHNLPISERTDGDNGIWE